MVMSRRARRSRGRHVPSVAQTRMPRQRSVRFARGMSTFSALLAVSVVGVSGCVVSGEPSAQTGDLSSLSVTAEDFPVAGATRVPATAVVFALNGLAGSDPATTSPPDCTPHRPDDAGAVVWQVIVDGGSSSYTTAVARTSDDLAAVVDQARRCPDTRTGDTQAGSAVSTRIAPAPAAPPHVDTAALRRTTRTGDAEHQVALSSYTLIGQRGDVRVYAQYRWPGTDDISPDATARLTALFAKAASAAFGD